MKRKITGIILSAGYSSRMGEPKALLDYNGNSFLLTIIQKLLLECESICVVLGHDAEKIKHSILLEMKDKFYDSDKIRFIRNYFYEKGMFTSLKCAMESKVDSLGYLFHQVDQPHLPFPFYENFTNEFKKNIDWLQPTNKGQKGHPIIFGNKIKKIIMQAPNDSNLREVVKNNYVNKVFWECGYPEILEDIDTPKDYKKLLEK